METLILTQKEIKGLLTMEDALNAVEHAFEMHGLNAVQMPAKIYLEFQKGDLRAMPAYLDGKAGVKWVNSHPGNREVGLPTVMALLIYNDPETGFPLAVMDATHITNMRTGAAGGIASKYLARPNSKVLGFVGCGTQAYTQLLAHKGVFEIKEAKCFDIREENSSKFIEFCEAQGIPAEVLELEEVCNCDILITTTPSRKPIVRREWISEGTHINAIGADAPGKQELDPEIIRTAKVFVDDKEQAFHSGEVNVPLAKGVIREEDIAGTIGEVITGKIKGREGNEITVFDSTGLAIQDIATASIVFQRATEKNVGTKITFF
ncbi:MAG: alanine dehydrogenase [Archaeoglobus sp.]|nr:alanine dehydrogenase [Archaeoglobus sp.]